MSFFLSLKEKKIVFLFLSTSMLNDFLSQSFHLAICLFKKGLTCQPTEKTRQLAKITCIETFQLKFEESCTLGTGG